MAVTQQDAVAPPAALEAATLCEAFQLTASERGDAPALRAFEGGLSLSWAEYAQRVRSVAAGLAALGLRRGDALALMLRNRPEFNVVDAAALHLGATPFSVYNTSPPEQVAFLFANAGNRIAVTERALLPVVRAAAEQSGGIDRIVVIDGGEEEDLTLADVEAAGDPAFDFGAAWRAVRPDDVATLIYTSGTTGPPKGVELTHTNLIAEVRAMFARAPSRPHGRVLSFLPSAHIADRWSAHYHASMTLGFEVTTVADARRIAEALAAVRPTIFGSVPRVDEKLKAALEARGIAEPAQLPEDARAALRARLGLDAAEWLVVGAAPCPVEVIDYFGALGLPLCELWGMSELSCCATCNPPGGVRAGTVGPAVDGVELRVADDGELLARGALVMRGYRGDPERTAETIDADGWLHTGDVATIDADGYVTIVDRKKELIINAAGKNMSPANIEMRLKAHPLVGQAMAIGDRRPYNVALIVLDPEVGAAFAQEHGLVDGSAAALAAEPAVRAEIERAVAEANEHLSRVEQIKRFAILPLDWEPGGDELTPTMKLRRRPIADKYAREIEALYAA
jgi:long-subunit acyl-CoA synthetase (AMP-forming)